MDGPSTEPEVIEPVYFVQPFVEGYEHINPNTYDFERCWTRTNRDGPYNPDDVVAAILATSGDYGRMSGLLGRNRSRIREYILSHPDIRAIRDDVLEANIDRVEQVGMLGALMGDLAQVRFVLSTVGKDRGYTTKTESVITVDPIENTELPKDPIDASKAYQKMISGK